MSEWVESAARHSLSKQDSTNGYLPAGHNGPYFDPETPVRNTAHYLYLYSSLYERTQSHVWYKAAENAINFLKSESARPHGKTFYCRDKQGKDKCNGLVGQAWVIEALVKAAKVFERTDCYKLAEEVFLLHPWNDGCSIWSRVEIDGNVLPIDRTFNHQLWFAMSGAMLTKTPLAQDRAKSFLNDVARKVEMYDNGVIFHNSQLGMLMNYRHLGWRFFLRQLKAKIVKPKLMQDLYSKSVGYHGFNLYAFSMLKQLLPDEPIWQSNLSNRWINACEKSEFIETLKLSQYGYFYNVSGLEIAVANEVFLNDKNNAQTWISRQIKYSLDRDNQSFTRNVADINTALSRIYVVMSMNNDYKFDYFE